MHASGIGEQGATRPRFSPRRSVFLILVPAICLAFSGCTQRPQAQSAPPTQSTQTPTPQAAALPPPQLSEIQEAVKRVFKDAAVIDTSRNPGFIVGDFNGDISQDVAVVLKVAPGKVSQMNQQFPPWILKDPSTMPAPGTSPLRVTEGETLLAVIHGYGPGGWRDPQATQTYLLKNALGTELAARAKAEVIAANQGKDLPQLRGDLIGETIRGKSEYLYYAESTYSWYDPATFKGGPVPRPVHPGFAVRN